MQNHNKIKGYLGFCIKARKIIYGSSLISQFKHKIYLLVSCKSASKNAMDDALKIANKNKVKMIQNKQELLEELVNKPNCKLVAITDSNLAIAIENSMNEQYEILNNQGGVPNDK